MGINVVYKKMQIDNFQFSHNYSNKLIILWINLLTVSHVSSK